MASNRQIAANRRNARQSTGPRSSAGRNRSRRNSYRHGLAAGVTLNAERLKHIERLARKIAGNSADVMTVERARTLAQAEYELVQIRRSKVALISRVMASNGLSRGSSAASSLFQNESQFRQCQQQNRSAPPKRYGGRCRN